MAVGGTVDGTFDVAVVSGALALPRRLALVAVVDAARVGGALLPAALGVVRLAGGASTSGSVDAIDVSLVTSGVGADQCLRYVARAVATPATTGDVVQLQLGAEYLPLNATLLPSAAQPALARVARNASSVAIVGAFAVASNASVVCRYASAAGGAVFARHAMT